MTDNEVRKGARDTKLAVLLLAVVVILALVLLAFSASGCAPSEDLMANARTARYEGEGPRPLTWDDPMRPVTCYFWVEEGKMSCVNTTP